jgi:hypothetical protein
VISRDGAIVRADPSINATNIIGAESYGSQFEALGEFLPCDDLGLSAGCDSWARIVYAGHEQAWICLGSGTTVYGRLDYPSD